MKKTTMMMVTALIIVGLVAGTVWAGNWGGPRGGGDRGYCGAAGSGPMSQAFSEDTFDLRKQMAVKHGEYQALMAGENPDPGQAGKLKQEMFEIREQLRTKAREHNLPMSPRAGRPDWCPRGNSPNGRGGPGR